MTTFHSTWQRADLIDIKLNMNEVHLWLVNLQVAGGAVRELAGYLVPAESARAARFYFERDRDHYIVSHAVLRLLLAHYCRCTPATLRFTTNSYDKPALEGPADQPPFYFNLSHSHEMALIGVTEICELGVDIEHMRAEIEYEQMATHFFSKREVADLSRLPQDLKADGFFNAWTRKEAYIKARGKGVSIPLDQFDVSLVPGEPAALLETREPGQITADWSMYAFAGPPSYKVALALPAHDIAIHCFHWDNLLIV